MLTTGSFLLWGNSEPLNMLKVFQFDRLGHACAGGEMAREQQWTFIDANYKGFPSRHYWFLFLIKELLLMRSCITVIWEWGPVRVMCPTLTLQHSMRPLQPKASPLHLNVGSVVWFDLNHDSDFMSKYYLCATSIKELYRICDCV